MSTKAKTVSIALTDDNAEKIEAIKRHMQEKLPGIQPDNSDALRHALHVAAGTVATKHHAT